MPGGGGDNLTWTEERLGPVIAYVTYPADWQNNT